MEPGAVTACSGISTVAFSWEHQPGVSKSKQGPVEAAKKPSGGKRPVGTKKAEAKPHRLRVPPPPGGPGAPALSPPARRSGSRSRGGVRPEEDPFLAAYLACTASGRKGGSGPKGSRKLLGWSGLGLGLVPRFGLSCKTSCGVVEHSVVGLAKITELDDH